MRTSIAALIAVNACAVAFAAPFGGLGEDELRTLSSGAPVIRIVKNAKELSLIPADEASRGLREDFAKLKPNYLAELMLDVPAGKGLEALEAALLDFPAYPKIRYYSVRNKTFYDLFDSVRVLSDYSVGGTRKIETMISMVPFVDYGGGIELKKGVRSLEFRLVNRGPIIYSYQDLKASDAGEMVWRLYAVESGGRLYCYAAGGIRAFDLFGLFRDRLEASFIGRIKSFFGYAFDRVLAAR